MAKQVGIIKLIGKMGNTSFYHTRKHGYLARKITSVNAERIQTDPAFARVRENNTDFGRCAFGVKILRAAFIPMFTGVADPDMTSRLTQTLMGVIKSDPTSAPGMRRLELGDMRLVRGFEFNKATSLTRVLKASYTTEINRMEGVCTVAITPSAGMFVKRRPGATHFRFLLGVALIDFKTGAHTVEHIRSAEISVRKHVDTPVVFTSLISHAGEGHLFVTLGVEYLQHVNGEFCLLSGKKYAALTLIHVERVYREIAPKKIVKDKIPARLRWDIQQVHSLRAAVSFNGFSRCKRRYLLPTPSAVRESLVPECVVDLIRWRGA